MSAQQQSATTPNWGSPQGVQEHQLESLLVGEIAGLFKGKPQPRQPVEGQVSLRGRSSPVRALITYMSPGSYQIRVPRGYEFALSLALAPAN